MNQTKKKIIRPTALAFLLALGLSAAMPAGAGTAYAQPVQEVWRVVPDEHVPHVAQ